MRKPFSCDSHPSFLRPAATPQCAAPFSFVYVRRSFSSSSSCKFSFLFSFLQHPRRRPKRAKPFQHPRGLNAHRAGLNAHGAELDVHGANPMRLNKTTTHVTSTTRRLKLRPTKQNKSSQKKSRLPGFEPTTPWLEIPRDPFLQKVRSINGPRDPFYKI